ncbi:MAG: zf-HC2 domain-containing protein [Firmicutes bacterium]|nr:zf-HC2 domain-containing protein [Bacillota bacterium]
MKNNCEYIKSLLSEYIDDMLPSDKTQEVHLHISQCASCAEQHRLLCAVVEELKVLPTEPLPPDFLSKLSARTDTLKGRRFSLPPLKGFSAVAAGLLLLLLIRTGYNYYSLSQIKTAYIDDAPIETQNNEPLLPDKPTEQVKEQKNIEENQDKSLSLGQNGIAVENSSNEKQKSKPEERTGALQEQPKDDKIEENSSQESPPDESDETEVTSEMAETRMFSLPVENDAGEDAQNSPRAARANAPAAGGSFYTAVHDNDQPSFVSVKIMVDDFEGAAAALAKKYGVKEQNGEVLLELNNDDFQQVMNLMLEYGARVEQSEENELLTANKCIIISKNRD